MVIFQPVFSIFFHSFQPFSVNIIKQVQVSNHYIIFQMLLLLL